MNKKPVAFVGPTIVHNALSDFSEDWDLQIPLESLDDLNRELNLDEDESRISKNTSMIIFYSRLFRTNPKKFAELVAYTAPYSVVCILIQEKDKALEQERIRQAIESQQRDFANLYQDPFNDNVPFYFVTYENAQSELYDAIMSYSKSSYIEEDIKQSIRTLLPNSEIPIIDEYKDEFEDDFTDEINIPEKEDGQGTIITVTSSKGGSGKSTVAMMVGAYLKRASQEAATKGIMPKAYKVCLVDLDVRDGQLGFLNDALRPSVIDILTSANDIQNITEDDVRKGIFHNDDSGLDFIFATKRPRTATDIPESLYVKVINKLRSMYDFIILDTSVHYTDVLLNKVAYPMSDLIFLVSDFCKPSIFGMNRWIKENTNEADGDYEIIPREKVKIILNKALDDVYMPVEKIEKAADGLPIVAVFPSSPKLITYLTNISKSHRILNEEVFFQTTKELIQEVLPLSINL